MNKEINIKSNQKQELIDITDKVKEIVNDSDIKEGTCIIYCPHTTAAITINENADPSVKKDIIKELNKIIPEQDNYSHMEGNSHAHIKSSVIGCSEKIIVKNSTLILGTWQGIMFCEFDGPRNRKVIVRVNK